MEQQLAKQVLSQIYQCSSALSLCVWIGSHHYSDVIMGTIASKITSLKIVYSTVYSGAEQRKPQSSASLAFVRGIHLWPVNSPHKWPVTRKMLPFDDVIMFYHYSNAITSLYGVLFWFTLCCLQIKWRVMGTFNTNWSLNKIVALLADDNFRLSRQDIFLFTIYRRLVWRLHKNPCK